MKVRRKKPLSLIEVSIAAGLISVVLYILFSAYRNASYYATRIKDAKETVIETQLLYQRCLQIFSFVNPDIKTSGDSISFKFENHLDPELIYSGIVDGTISLKKGELLLQIHSTDRKKIRTELLKKDVQKVHFDTAVPNVLVMTINSNITYAFFLPKTDTQGFAVKAEKKS